MNLRDSKKRNVRDLDGNCYVTHLKRFRCADCGTIHTQLPDCLVPYHQYPADLIAGALAGNVEATPAADNSTIYRWHIFYYRLVNFICSCRKQMKHPVSILVNHLPDNDSLLRNSLFNTPDLISAAAIYYFLVPMYISVPMTHLHAAFNPS